MTIDTQKFKKILEMELAKLETELSSVGRRNPQNPNDWQALPKASNADSADRNEVADSIEDYEENTAILKDLEIRYNEVKSALEKIQKNTFGICEVGAEPIDEKRLIANPAARTCQGHMNQSL